MVWLPAKLAVGLLGRGHEDGRVAGSTCPFDYRNSFSADFLRCTKDLTHGVSLSRAKVPGRGRATLSQMLEGQHVGIGQILDVDVVAHAGSIGRAPVRSQNGHLRDL